MSSHCPVERLSQPAYVPYLQQQRAGKAVYKVRNRQRLPVAIDRVGPATLVNQATSARGGCSEGLVFPAIDLNGGETAVKKPCRR